MRTADAFAVERAQPLPQNPRVIAALSDDAAVHAACELALRDAEARGGPPGRAGSRPRGRGGLRARSAKSLRR